MTTDGESHGRRRSKEEEVKRWKEKKSALTDVLETDGTRRVVEVHTADVQRVELGDVVSSNLHRDKHTSEFIKPSSRSTSVCPLQTADYFL